MDLTLACLDSVDEISVYYQWVSTHLLAETWEYPVLTQELLHRKLYRIGMHMTRR